MPVYPSEDIVRAAREKARPQARIAAVEPYSPADDAGFEPGCLITTVDGQPVRDIIDWRWLTADDVITLGYVDLDGEEGEVELEREEGEDWGLSFEGAVFDGVRQCRNACTFCFMRQLPHGMRPSLTLRDDDFRLSFLAGTFVTLTNLTAEDEARILEQRISPLRVSLHAADAQARRALIGRHAAHGIEALDRLLAAGIEVHAQIVLVPGANDGAVLEDTLRWAYERLGILNIGIVPLGYTRFQTTFDRSFNEPAAARAVIAAIEPFQQRARAERGTPWVFAADEFYRNAYGNLLLEHLPPASHYGDFSMFEDGIGIIRSYVDDFRSAHACGLTAGLRGLYEAKAASGTPLPPVRFIVGEAMSPFMSQLVGECGLSNCLQPLYVPNRYFGGNVDVTGLLTAQDIVSAIGEVEECLASRSGFGAGERLADGSTWGAALAVPDDSPLDGWNVAEAQQSAEGAGCPARSSAATETAQWAVSQSEDCLSTGRPAPSASAEADRQLAFRSEEPHAGHPAPSAAAGVKPLFCAPSVIFNDDAVTLDDASVADMKKATGAQIAVVSCNPSDFLTEIISLLS